MLAFSHSSLYLSALTLSRLGRRAPRAARHRQTPGGTWSTCTAGATKQDEAPEQIFPHTPAHLHCVHCRKAVQCAKGYGFTLVWSARHTDTDKHGGAWAWPRVYPRACPRTF